MTSVPLWVRQQQQPGSERVYLSLHCTYLIPVTSKKMALGEEERRPRKVTQDLVLASTSLSRFRSEGTDSFLERITHLHLQNKRIRHIAKLEKCANLKVLYLYDNMIEEIAHLDFAKKLQYLHLENNAIKTMPTLTLISLSKLYLDENEISLVRGLEACKFLEELYIAKQRLPSRAALQFERSSLVAISQTLQVLDISGNKLESLEDFKVLTNLRKLHCKDNGESVALSFIQKSCLVVDIAVHIHG